MNQFGDDRLSRVSRTEVSWKCRRINEYELIKGFINTKVMYPR